MNNFDHIIFAFRLGFNSQYINIGINIGLCCQIIDTFTAEPIMILFNGSYLFYSIIYFIKPPEFDEMGTTFVYNKIIMWDHIS